MEDFFWRDFLGRNFLEGFFGRIFLEGFFLGGFFGRIFWEDFLEKFFGRNYLAEISKELMIFSRFWGNFVSMEGRRKKEEGRILDP